jgi:hypothetical protein
VLESPHRLGLAWPSCSPRDNHAGGHCRSRSSRPRLFIRDPVGYTRRMFHKLITVAAWVLLAFVAYATISPIQDRPIFSASPNFERLAAFAVLGALFCLVYPRHIVLVCMVVLGSAVLLEIAQQLTPDRHGRIHDAIIKMTGGALGVVAGRAILYFPRAHRWFPN